MKEILRDYKVNAKGIKTLKFANYIGFIACIFGTIAFVVSIFSMINDFMNFNEYIFKMVCIIFIVVDIIFFGIFVILIYLHFERIFCEHDIIFYDTDDEFYFKCSLCGYSFTEDEIELIKNGDGN